jgi:hypothetical protein
MMSNVSNDFQPSPTENATVSPAPPPPPATVPIANTVLPTQFTQSLLTPNSGLEHDVAAEFDPGYPDVNSQDNTPITDPSPVLSLPSFDASQIVFFPTPIPLSSPTTLDYTYTPLWSKENVVNAKELEELLITLLSSHMQNTLHAHRLKSFEGFANAQCDRLQQIDAKYQAMLFDL